MTITAPRVATDSELARKVEKAGFLIARIGLVVTIGWIGATKFTVAESQAIEPLVSRSPFLSWMLDLVEIRTLSSVFGVIELVAAVLIALGLVRAIFDVVGGLIAIGLFLTTISFLFTSTDYEHSVPFLSAAGPFIVKDIVLLGASLIIFAAGWIRLVDKRSAA
jgi:reactive chlorine resistance protein C